MGQLTTARMKGPLSHNLSRRERQIMDILYRTESASAADVRSHMPEPPSYSAVRAHLRILEDKGHVEHEKQGPRYVYRPTVPASDARRSALRHVVRTFFEGSTTQAVAALLGDASVELADEEYERLVELIEQARQEGR